jgi:two-component system, sensor histidine kinase and response regulator
MAKQGKILLIDDDQDFVMINRTILESSGYLVDAATEARTALDKIKSWQPDLICLDVMMPSGTEGFHLAYKIRHDPEMAAIPILMISAIHDHSDFRFSPDDGDYLPVDAFLEKPVRAEHLLQKVEQLLSEASRSQEQKRTADKGIGLKMK